MTASSTFPRKIERISRANGSFRVWTIHPKAGRIFRGAISPVRDASVGGFMTWRLGDAEHTDVQVLVTGNYLSAEEALLGLSAWADEPCDEEEED